MPDVLYHKPPKKRAKVLRIHDAGDGHKFQVIGGLRFVGFCQGIGFHVDVAGWRARVSFRAWSLRECIRHWRYHYRFRWRGYNPPWEYLEIHCAPFRITIGPAYGGWLEP